jgi:hypothetical protein
MLATRMKFTFTKLGIMPSITDAAVRMLGTGQVLRSDCFGNNAAVECPKCLSYPVLIIAVRNQRGSSPVNPGRCRRCGCGVFIVDDLNVDRLDVLDLDVVDEQGSGADAAQSSPDLNAGVSIPIDDFLSFVRTLEGEVIPTLAGRAQFTVRVVDNGLEFTPRSTEQPRGHTRAYVQRVLDRFRETGSMSTADYQFTVNASYQLALIDRFLRR